jgi:putative NADH-flavin reductase
MELQQKSPVYKVLIIGANGGIGRCCVEQALNAGHQVTAVLRNPANLNLNHAQLQIVKGDLMQPETFESYLEDQDVVISAIGVKGGFGSDKPTTLYSQGNANLLKAMQGKRVKRIFFISASAVEVSPALSFFIRFMVKYVVQKLLRHMYADLLRMETIVRASDTNWTIIRPPELTNKPVTGRYRYAVNKFLKDALKISRADVAHFMLSHIADEETYHATIEVAY